VIVSALVRTPVAVGAMVLFAPIAVGQSCTTTRISVGPGGQEVAQGSQSFAITPDGRFVAYWSMADGITANDVNGRYDVFLYDRQLGTNALISVSSSGAQGNFDSYDPFVSADGRVVVFSSDADNLVLGDTNGQTDVFVRDVLTGQTTRVSVHSNGTEANHFSLAGGISADGRWISMRSEASNLVDGDTNGWHDCFVHDRLLAQTIRASVTSSGVEGNDGTATYCPISADGRWVTFDSSATNFVPGDTNGYDDIFVKDLLTGQLTRVNIGPGGVEADGASEVPVISGDGRYIAFTSSASNLVTGDNSNTHDAFVHDRVMSSTLLLSAGSSGQHGPGPCSVDSISPDGRFIAFSTGNALEPGDTNGKWDIYVRDLVASTVSRVNYSSTGQEAERNCFWGKISQDASVVSFSTEDATLVPGDTNFGNDVFVRDCPFPQGPSYASFCQGTAHDCPCSNGGDGVGGCENSRSTGGAELTAHGSASMSIDTLRLDAWRLPHGVPSLFVQSSATTPTAPYGDGILCIGGTLIRLGIRTSTDGAVEFGFGIAGDAPLSVLGNLPPAGGTRNYQVVYRNAETFCTSGTFNLTNAVAVSWSP